MNKELDPDRWEGSINSPIKDLEIGIEAARNGITYCPDPVGLILLQALKDEKG